MKKTILLSSVVLFSAHLFAADFTGVSVGSTGGISMGSSISTSGSGAMPQDKQLMIAASDDAMEFIRSEGTYRSAMLDAAIEALNDYGNVAALSDLQKAEMIVQISQAQ